MAKISIHLITWNGQKYIEECLNSILKQSYKDYLLLIIDNGSVDQTCSIIDNEFVPVFGKKIRFLKNKENLGFAKAHNQALLWTDSEYVLILNQDVVLDKNFIAELVEFLDANDQAGSATGKLLRWQFANTEDLKKSEKTDIIDSLGLKIFKNQRAVEIGTGEIDQGQYEKVKEVFGVSATCPVYRRKALFDLRYDDEFFDNDFFSYKEDVDLAYRLRWRGWRSFYVPQALAYHDRTAQTKEKISNLEVVKQRRHKSKFINYHSYKNHWFVLYKNLSGRLFRKFFFHIFFYECKKFVYLLFAERKTLAGLRSFLRKKKIMKKKRIFIMKKRLIKDEQMIKWFE